MAEISKGDAVEFAVSVRKLVDALIAEGFDEFYAKEFVARMYEHRIK